MKRHAQEPVEAKVVPVEGEYLKTRYRLQGEAPAEITVGKGKALTPLALKEVYAKGVKTALELGSGSCLFDLTAAAELGRPGLCAAAEGICGGGYKVKYALSGQCEPPLTCYAGGEGFTEEDLSAAWALARNIMEARNQVNCPGNLLTPELFAQKLADLAHGLPVQAQVYHQDELCDLGLNALLYVGDSSGNLPTLTVLRYTGAPESGERLGLVGKGITFDSGGYCLKPRASLEHCKGDMAGGAAVAAAVRALAAAGAKVNVTAVVPAAENRVSRESGLPGDVITSLSGQTIEVLNTDAEGRLILSDALTWAVRQEGCTRLVDVATLTGAMASFLGGVATGVMANDESWYASLEAAAALSGERFWRVPDFPEYEKLVDSDYADMRNTTKGGCGAIAAGMFLRRFTEGRPWLHLDIAGTSDGKVGQWQHQGSGATGVAVSTLYHLALGLAQE